MLELTRGEQSLVLAPEFGGAILGWTWGDMPLLRRPSPDAVLRGRSDAMGCFPQIPYCNRIAFRRFDWDGRRYELAANFGDSPHAIHGVGWQRPWEIAPISPASATLTLRHDAEDAASRAAWPFAFAARFTYHLIDRGMCIEIEATNLHAAPAPMGLGVHPWFPRTPGATITFRANGVWFTEHGLPTRHGAIPPRWDHAAGRAVAGERLDNCFTGWDRVALIPAMRIQADPLFGNLQVFTPPDADFFCVEPNSHMPDAINRTGLPPDQAMCVLAPGESVSGTILLLRV